MTTRQTATARATRGGFTAVELLVSIAIVGVLIAILLPAIQYARESARMTSCKNNLRQLAIAASSYYSSHQHFPPGYLGVDPDTPAPPMADPDTDAPDAQWIGVLPFLLGHLDLQIITEKLDKDLFRVTSDGAAWWTRPTAWEQAQIQITVFECPSDRVYSEISQGTIALIHQWSPSPSMATQSAPMFAPPNQAVVGRTNYVGVAGKYGKLDDPIAKQFRGILANRTQTREEEIIDGKTHTMLFGEALGGMDNFQRAHAYSWMGVGALATYNGIPDLKTKGDWQRFSSLHEGAVHFAFADGAVHGLKRGMDEKIYFGMSGINDSVRVEEGVE